MLIEFKFIVLDNLWKPLRNESIYLWIYVHCVSETYLTVLLLFAIACNKCRSSTSPTHLFVSQIMCFCFRLVIGSGNSRTIILTYIMRNMWTGKALILLKISLWCQPFLMLVPLKNGDQWLETLLNESVKSIGEPLLLIGLVWDTRIGRR